MNRSPPDAAGLTVGHSVPKWLLNRTQERGTIDSDLDQPIDISMAFNRCVRIVAVFAGRPVVFRDYLPERH